MKKNSSRRGDKTNGQTPSFRGSKNERNNQNNASTRKGGKSTKNKPKSNGRYSDKRNNKRNDSPQVLNSSKDQKYKGNGEKGAESHTVTESYRITLSNVLNKFREDDDVEMMELPSTLTNTERKFVHEEARRLGLISKSHGKGDERKIKIKKHTQRRDREREDKELPMLDLGYDGVSTLFEHIQKHPICRRDSADTNLSTQKSINIGKRRVKYTKPNIPFDNAKKVKKNKNQKPSLPIEGFKGQILSIIDSNPITILTGDTGCGKSTQLPQFILKDNPNANIIVTQPRRISAVSLADRVSWELSEEVGNTVGYTIRMNSVSSSKKTRIMFATPGIVLQKLDSLKHYTHIILDEIHERDQYTEFLMMTLRQEIEKGKMKNTKLILMSATMPDRQQLIDYWSNVAQVGEITVPGRMFPVQDFFLEHILEMVQWEGKDWQKEQDMFQLDKDLASLIRCNNNEITSNKQGSGLMCVMCLRKNFSSAEELGTHVALCTGNTNDIVELEDRVRNMNTFNGIGSYTKTINLPEEEELYYINDDNEFEEDEFEQDEENLGKWDGHSQFFATDVGSTTNSSTFTQEQLLSQYQSLNSDEQIDESLLLSLIQYLIQSSFGDGAILIFFAGWNEITSFQMLLEGSPPFCNNHQNFVILPLHSSIDTKDQRRVFQKVPKGVRKIVLATNIAETSVTIDDVSFVGKLPLFYIIFMSVFFKWLIVNCDCIKMISGYWTCQRKEL